MTPTDAHPQTLQELRDLVHRTLCARENLLADQARLHQQWLRTGESVCGLQFFVYGPRLVRLSAVWSRDQNVLYFYDADGERFSKLSLDRPIDLSDAIPQRAAS